MKRVSLLAVLISITLLQLKAQPQAKTENIILVTFDGFRWKEVFDGPQKNLLESKKFTPKNSEQLTEKYWDKDPKVRREKLMPFFWHTIATTGQMYGNRAIGSRAQVTNMYQISYPGYNEIFTGRPSVPINRNTYGLNTNPNIFDFLSEKGFSGKMAGFATWDAFTRIINEGRTKVPVYCALKCDSTGCVCTKDIAYNKWQTTIPIHNTGASTDTLTYHVAKEYLQLNHPRFAFIGFDETDEDAHEGHYADYLNIANTLDRYIEDLWKFVQNDPVYRNKTTIIITCDHGRGDKILNYWQSHHTFIPHSKNTWLVAIGAGIAPVGEVKGGSTLKQKQIAATIAKLFGYDYKKGHGFGKPFEGIAGSK